MRVLIIEDEKKLADSIKKGLEQEAYAADVSYEGTDGFGLAVTCDYDIIVLDIMLPGMDGIGICRKLREKNISTPIIMLTARGQVKDRVQGLNSGSDDYLVKPFAFEELLARIKALSRRPKKNIGLVLSMEDLRLNTLTYEVSRCREEVKLSKKEYAILEFLLRNKGKILTKKQIIDHVWDYDADVLSNTVEVYIGYLRDKIDRPFGKSKPLIHTVRGFGYRLGGVG